MHQKDIISKLNRHDFSPLKIWSRVNVYSPFNKYSNQESIDLIKKDVSYNKNKVGV